MRGFALAAFLAAAPSLAMAAGAEGVWKTALTANGSYLEVTFGPCASDAALTCGTITGAFTKDGPDSSYVNLGKTLVADMRLDGDGRYSGGTIWDPRSDKIYKSKLTLEGDRLGVEGCIAFFCRGQDWSRVR